MRRRVRQWWRAAIAAAAILSPQAAAAQQPVHDVRIVAARFAFEPTTIQVTASERVRLVIQSKDVVHLSRSLGIRDVVYTQGNELLAATDVSLAQS
jgi:plastocyanin